MENLEFAGMIENVGLIFTNIGEFISNIFGCFNCYVIALLDKQTWQEI